MIPIDHAAIRADVHRWLGLVRTGAWAALASVALIALQIALYLIWPRRPQPRDSSECWPTTRSWDCSCWTCSTR